jgi:hypothetical protein
MILNWGNQSSCHHNPSSEKNENLSAVKEKNDSLKVKISFLFEGGSVFCPDFYGLSTYSRQRPAYLLQAGQ